MVRQNRKNTITALNFERPARELIRSMLELCEKRILSGNMDKASITAMTHAAMSAKYAIQTFLALVEDGIDE